MRKFIAGLMATMMLCASVCFAAQVFQGNVTGSATTLATARNLAGNSFNGSADTTFNNKFVVQGTADTGLTGAQFLGALVSGLVKNTTSTGVLSIATAGTDYTVGSTGLAGGQTIAGGTLTAQNLTLRANAADTTTGAVAITTSTASTTKTTGALTVAGGVGVAGAINANDLTVTNTISGSVSGNAANVTGTVLPSHGGTGVANNDASTLTISGSYGTTLTVSGPTTLTLPTSGTVITSTTSGGMTCITLGGKNTCGYAGSIANNGTLTLPTVTAGYSGQGEITVGADADHAQFTTDASGNVNLVWTSAGIVANAATANKVQIGAVSPANPVVITNASGGALTFIVDYNYK